MTSHRHPGDRPNLAGKSGTATTRWYVEPVSPRRRFVSYRITVIGLLLVTLLIAGGIAAAGGVGDDGTDTAAGSIDEQAFIGLTLGEATTLAAEHDRLWRISRQDATDFAVTADLMPGRVTFEVDAGVVTAAIIERPNTDPPNLVPPEDPARARLIAAGLLRLVTDDNTFGGEDVFDDIRVARHLGSDRTALAPLDLELAAAVLSEYGTVTFIDDPAGQIEALFDASPAGIAIVKVERIELLDDHAEIELSLWCGSLCGVYITYGAVPSEDGWEITGPIGPIAVS